MAAAPDSDGRVSRKPLGELLVQHGLVSQEQLALALAEQAQTQRPLGEIVVERGFVSGALVAQALATQQGGLLKTEYGYATGFSATPSHASPPPPPVSLAPPPAPDAATRIRELEGLLAANENEHREAMAVKDAEWLDRIAALEARLEDAFAQLATLRRDRDALAESELNLRAELAEREALVAELQGRAAERPSEDVLADLATLRRELDALAGSELRLRADLAERTREYEAAARELAEVRAEQVEPPPADRHYAFVEGAEGYELLERSGPPPAAGETVEIDGEQLLVLRIGSAPLPGARVPCAYMIRA